MTDVQEIKKGPRVVRKSFLKNSSRIAKAKEAITHKPEMKDELREYVFVLMKENGYTEIIEGVPPGPFIITTGDVKKQINLTPNKLTTIKYNNQYFKGWVGYENDTEPYPSNPLHTSREMKSIIQRVSMNFRDRDEDRAINASTKRWLMIAGVIALIILVLSGSTEFRQMIGSIGKGENKGTDTETPIVRNEDNLTISVNKGLGTPIKGSAG